MIRDEEKLTPNTFRVEVVNPAGIYLLAKSDAVLNQTRDEFLNMSNYELSRDILDSDLLEFEHTSLITGTSERGQAEYYFQTVFMLGDKEKQSARQGYLSETEIEALVDDIRSKGLVAEKLKSEDHNGVNIIFDGGIKVELELGYKNKERHRDLLLELTKMQETRKAGFGLITKRTQSNFSNTGYGLSLWEVDPNTLGLKPKTTDEESFEKNLRLYASTYEKVIDSLHKATGTTPPIATVTFEPHDEP